MNHVEDFINWAVDDHPYWSIVVAGPFLFGALCFICWLPLEVLSLLSG